jgi:hypothetical protein
MRLLGAVLVSGVVLSCGEVARTTTHDYDAGDTREDAKWPDDVVVADGNPGDGCHFADGSPMCDRPGCAPTCDVGCVDFEDSAGTSGPGLCAGDESVFVRASFVGVVPCTVCPGEDTLCGRTVLGLSCVKAEACSALALASFEDGCLFQDKTRWKSSTAIDEPPCPAGGPEIGMCGGLCGGCAPGFECMGRSPRHPFGICADFSPPRFACTRNGDSGTNCGSADDLCATFDVGIDGKQDESDRFGFCLPISQCQALESALPGGVSCYAKGGIKY